LSILFHLLKKKFVSSKVSSKTTQLYISFIFMN
jgi:hypothetical protein